MINTNEPIFSDMNRKIILSYIKDQSNQRRLQVNTSLFQMLEKRIIDLLKNKLVADLGKDTASKVMERIAPINYYRKVIDKLTTIYQYGVYRKVKNGTDADADLLSWYEQELGINTRLNANNEFYNAYCYSLLQFTLKEPEGMLQKRTPFCRSIPNNQFLVMNTNSVDPAEADVYILIMDPMQIDGETQEVFHVYTDTEFMVMNGKGDIIMSEMDRLDQDGINTFGTVPFVYANASENLVMPELQEDDMEMSLLIPLLLTDLNYATKFQAFSTLYTIDADDSELKINPDTIINLKTEEGADAASIGSIKPTVDIDKVLSLGSSLVSLWLTAKGIRPGAVGSLNKDSFASGVSKMIDESDTYESRIKQIEEYKRVEDEFWDKILKVYHPVWVGNAAIDNTALFSPEASVETIFPQPRPMQTRLELLQELGESIALNLESRKGALKALNPDWDETELEDKLAEIDADRTINALFEVENGQDQGNENEDQDQSAGQS